MALLDFIKEIQFYANQGSPVGEVLAKERLMEKESGIKLEQQQRLAQQEAMAQQQRAQAIASALPEQLQGFSGLVQAMGGDVNPAISLYKEQQAPAGKLTFDADGNPIQVIMGADGTPIAQRISGLQYKGGGNSDLSQAMAGFRGGQPAPQQEMPPVTLDTPLGAEPAIDPQTDAVMSKDYSQQPEQNDVNAQISRLMEIRRRVAGSDITKREASQQQAILGQIDAELKMLQGIGNDMKISPTTKTNLEAKTQAAAGVFKTVQKLRPLISDENVGLLGSARNTLQNLGEQGRAIFGYLLDVENDSVQYLRNRQDDIDQGYLFDPELPAVEALSRNLAYQVAVQRKGGGRLNIQDVENAKQEVGLSGLASGRSVGVKLDLLEEEARDTAASAFQELGRKAPEWVSIKPKGNQGAAQPRRIIYNAQGQRVSQ